MLSLIISTALMHHAAISKADEYFEKQLAGLPANEAIKLRQDRAESKEKNRLESIAERRHQEMCSAIRNSGKWF